MEQERERRKAEFHLSISHYTNLTYTIRKTTLDHFHPIHSIQITIRTLPHELSRVNITIRVKGPTYMRSTTILRVEGVEHSLHPAYTCIYASHIMHTSRGDCSAQPTQVPLLFPNIPVKSSTQNHQNHTKYDMDKL